MRFGDYFIQDRGLWWLLIIYYTCCKIITEKSRCRVKNDNENASIFSLQRSRLKVEYLLRMRNVHFAYFCAFLFHGER